MQHFEVEKRENHRRLDHDNDRNAQHELHVLGFVSDEKHREKHRHASAESRKNEKPLFGGSETYAVQFGDLLIVKANDYGNDRDYRNVCDKYRQKEIVLNKFRHIIVFL